MESSCHIYLLSTSTPHTTPQHYTCQSYTTSAPDMPCMHFSCMPLDIWKKGFLFHWLTLPGGMISLSLQLMAWITSMWPPTDSWKTLTQMQHTKVAMSFSNLFLAGLSALECTLKQILLILQQFCMAMQKLHHDMSPPQPLCQCHPYYPLYGPRPPFPIDRR